MVPFWLILASSQVYGTNIPDHFRDSNVETYLRCLRVQVNSDDELWSGPDPAAPTVVRYGQLITYCGRDRSGALASLRGFIKLRNPDWPAERIDRSAEFVLSGLELEDMLYLRLPDVAVHDYPPPDEF